MSNLLTITAEYGMIECKEGVWGMTKQPNGAADGFDRGTALQEFLEGSDIPQKYRTLLTEAVLLAADTHDMTPDAVIAELAERHQKDAKFLMRYLNHAVHLGWEYAVTPSSVLFQKRMDFPEYLQFAVRWLTAKEAAYARRRERADGFRDF